MPITALNKATSSARKKKRGGRIRINWGKEASWERERGERSLARAYKKASA